ncbi:MAG TPA: chorismate-binding protein, partial [Candidatus Acidoferrales bacterium]|nr:chorismate-binding protein [Candidatus Acidoferrales bacterium]
MSTFRVLAGVGPTLAFENPVEVLRDEAGDPDAALTTAQERLGDGAWIAGYLGYDGRVALGVFAPPREIELPASGAAPHSPLLSTVGRDDYEAAIHDLQRSIYEGDVYQVNYTVPFALETHGDPLALYAHYAHRTGAKYQAYVEDGARAILSWSPELFLALEGTRVETKPMKGTAPPDRVEELQSEKNRAEHLMIVDLLRNDLYRVCDRVSVEELFTVERYPTFATMTSTIAGELRTGTSFAQIVRATFPCGSVTGAPKRAAMQAIARSERTSRGAYCGSIGFLSPQRRGWWNVAIRTAQIDAATGIGRFDAGGGIVADSKADEEWEEVRLKARFLDPGDFAILETFASDADDAALRAHVSRMRSAARAFGVDFDAPGLIAALGSHASHDERRHLIRVRLHADGRFEILDEELERQGEPVPICIAQARVRSDDPFLRYKTTWRPAQDAAKAEGRRAGCFDALMCNERGELTEGWRTNLF